MKLIRHLYNLKPEHKAGVLTIGNFDGIHRGHQAMLELLAQLADKHQTHKVLMSFSPLPHEHFAANGTHRPNSTQSGSARLMSLREKINALQQLDGKLIPSFLLLTRFDNSLAAMLADDFIKDILVDQLAIKAVAVGDDFRFGKQRGGNLQILRSAGEKYGFEVVALSTHNVDNMRVSSTRIRQALQDNDMDAARNMLGRPYTIEGRIAHGDKRGRTIGFPTANIHLHRPTTALSGVYAVSMTLTSGVVVPGIANLGRRPTVGGERIQLEVHLFDFDKDIYGQHVSVSFHDKIRDEIKFDSFEKLKIQIQNDCETARRFHNIT